MPPHQSSASPTASSQTSNTAGTARLVRASAALVLMIATIGAHAQSEFDEDFDDMDKPWQEIAIQLPPAPKTENLLPFYVSPIATQSFAIDAASLTVGSDGVIRYTLVATSSGGAKNISYEGIRCATYESKRYAFGQADGSWARSRRNQWQTIHDNTTNRVHAALAKDYFCLELTVAGNAQDMVDRIRDHKTLAPQNLP